MESNTKDIEAEKSKVLGHENGVKKQMGTVGFSLHTGFQLVSVFVVF